MHTEGMYLYHMQRVQHLGPGHFAQGLEFCKRLSGNHRLRCYTLRTDAAQFSRDGVHNRHNSHVWSHENLHATVESNFQIRFIVSVWCAVLDDQVIGPFIFEGRLSGEMYLRIIQEELLQLL